MNTEKINNKEPKAGSPTKKRILTGLAALLLITSGVAIGIAASNNNEENSTNLAHSHDDDDHDHEYGDFLSDYSIEDTENGAMINVSINEEENTRTITSNALPNHETGEFPNEGNPNAISAQDGSWTFPLTGEYTGVATRASVPGVGISGVKFQPGTAERAVCENNITYNIEAVNLSEYKGVPEGLDFNNAHVQPWGEYHYHGVPESLVSHESEPDLQLVGFAADGHLMYHSISDAYSSSYQLGDDEREGINCVHQRQSGEASSLTFDAVKDGSLAQDWNYEEGSGDLDECNGTFVDGEYIYLVTDAYPYVPRCLMGDFTEESPDDAGGEQEQQRQQPRR